MTRHEHFPHRRPPWWPPDETWPPHRRLWRRGPRRVFFRVGCLAGLTFLLVSAILATVFWLTGQAVGLVNIPPGTFLGMLPLGVLVLLATIAGFALTVRSLRRMVLPMASIVEAAERVAEGDFSVRVAERGPRDVRRVAQVFNAMVARLERSAEQRRDLLADVTHELRTPLTIIQGSLEGLIDGVYPADEDHLRPILAETATLSQLVDDLRTLALAESGTLQLKKEPTDIPLLVRETAASFRARADAAGVTITVDEAPELPQIAVDPVRIREALANVIANALRYSPAGASITLRCRLETAAEGEKMVSVSVEDTGKGIAAEELPHVFDRFTKSSDSGGMGLGLAITRNLVSAHGGQIDVRSQPGKGTVVRLSLPAGE